METLRCPTCLTLIIDNDEKRCPACHSRLRKRGAPIVLGEATGSRTDRCFRSNASTGREWILLTPRRNSSVVRLAARPSPPRPPHPRSTPTANPNGSQHRAERSTPAARRGTPPSQLGGPVDHDIALESEPATPTAESTDAPSIDDRAKEHHIEAGAPLGRWDQLVAQAAGHIHSSPAFHLPRPANPAWPPKPSTRTIRPPPRSKSNRTPTARHQLCTTRSPRPSSTSPSDRAHQCQPTPKRPATTSRPIVPANRHLRVHQRRTAIPVSPPKPLISTIRPPPHQCRVRHGRRARPEHGVADSRKAHNSRLSLTSRANRTPNSVGSRTP